MEENTNYENNNSPITTKEWLKIILLIFIKDLLKNVSFLKEFLKLI